MGFCEQELTLSVIMIVKNEEKGIGVTLNSLAGINFKGSIYIWDTGSTDSTLEKVLAHELADQIKIGTGEFKDFSFARNFAQKFAMENGANWLLWLDANDEVCGNLPEPRAHLDGYLIQQIWHHNNKFETKFYNRRCFRADPKYIWKRRVHEFIDMPDARVITCSDFAIRQNRCVNSESSQARWLRDIDLLLLDLADDPNCSRTLFYLARAYKDTRQFPQARFWFLKRIANPHFPEERYWAAYYLAETYDKPNLCPYRCKTPELCEFCLQDRGERVQKQIYYYTLALKFQTRSEALVAMAQIMIDDKNWQVAYTYLQRALQLKEPADSVLFLRTEDYEYKRYHLMGIVAYYVGENDTGYNAVKKAIEVRNLEVDLNNLKWYKMPITPTPTPTPTPT